MPDINDITSFLQRLGALELGASPWPAFSEQDGERFPLDWHELFPRREFRTSDDIDWDFRGDPWEPDFDEYSDDIRAAVEQGLPAPDEGSSVAGGSQWDVCAWYQPIHFFRINFGIYIRQDCILAQASVIARFLPPAVTTHISSNRSMSNLFNALIRASVYTFFLHEQHHHKVESLALRLEVVDQQSVYIPYQRKVYQTAFGTDMLLEEALVSADAWHRLPHRPYESWITTPVVSATKEYLRWRFPHDPAGYRRAINYLTDSTFSDGANTHHSQVREATLAPLQPPHDWNIAPRMSQSMFQVNDRLWVVVPPGGKPLLPVKGLWP